MPLEPGPIGHAELVVTDADTAIAARSGDVPVLATPRIEALCGSLDQGVIVSSAFAQAAGEACARLVSLGRYLLKGVSRPQELYTLDPDRS